MLAKLLSLIFKVSKTKWTWRWYIVSTPWFGIKVHWIKPLEDEWHTHPWNGFSIIFGSYEEQKLVATERSLSSGQMEEGPWVRRRFFNRIGATTQHRTRGNCLTIFLHGPRVNENWFWGEKTAPWRGVQNDRVPNMLYDGMELTPEQARSFREALARKAADVPVKRCPPREKRPNAN